MIATFPFRYLIPVSLSKIYIPLAEALLSLILTGLYSETPIGSTFVSNPYFCLKIAIKVGIFVVIYNLLYLDVF